MKINFSELILLQTMNRYLGILFLITLNIYKDYFKGITADATQCKIFSQEYFEPERYTLVHLSIQEAVVFVYHRVL